MIDNLTPANANNKAEDLTIKKLTNGSETMAKMFEELKKEIINDESMLVDLYLNDSYGQEFEMYGGTYEVNGVSKNPDICTVEGRMVFTHDKTGVCEIEYSAEDYKLTQYIIVNREGFKDLPVSMNPFDEENSEPNYWLSCLLVNPEAMCKQVRGESEALYISEPGKSCPTEILDAISALNAEGRPIWKPMHMQPIYRMNAFVTREGDGRAKTNAYISGGTLGKDGNPLDVGMDIFHRGLCLPSDNKMTPEQQDIIIEAVKRCFDGE